MDYIKEAFGKVRNDMDLLKEEVNSLKKNFWETKERLIDLCEIIKDLSKEINQIRQTDQQIIPTDQQIIPTHPTHFEPLKPLNLGISIGNEGVPTDRQTDRQTDQHTTQSSYNQKNNPSPNKNNLHSNTYLNQNISSNITETSKTSQPIQEALEILDSLDNLKKEVRLKFKRLTDQEMLVFSTLYQLSEDQGYSDYREISIKMGLTESSIRDYIGRIIKKGIPVEKHKINNKNIRLSISQNLQKVATLSTIMKLREI